MISCSLPCSLTHSLTYSLTHLLTHSPTHSLTHLLTHSPISGQPEACNCVTEMLSTNIELQETKIGKREISIFVDKLRNSKMNSMYLSLLQSCCSCQGDGVDGNQCKIVELLFSNTNDIIIQLHRYSLTHLTSLTHLLTHVLTHSPYSLIVTVPSYKELSGILMDYIFRSR